MVKFLHEAWRKIDTIAGGIVGFFFRMLKKDYTPEKHNGIMQFLKFGMVGLSNTIISYVLYTAILLLLKKVEALPKIDYLIATFAAFMISVLWSFYWNNKFVFIVKTGKRRNVWKSLLKTYISYSFTGIFLNSMLMILWVEIVGVSEFIAPIINLCVSVPLNYIINKFWAFRAE